LVGTRTALVNQLRAELAGFWPGPLGLFRDLHSQISLAFLERYPGPADARGLGEQRLQAFLARQRYSGGQKPARLLAKLRRAPEERAPNRGDARVSVEGPALVPDCRIACASEVGAYRKRRGGPVCSQPAAEGSLLLLDQSNTVRTLGFSEWAIARAESSRVGESVVRLSPRRSGSPPLGDGDPRRG